MPLDPSIISSYNPTSGVDVNALMTQRMQGMANINAMERQRQADALALEDRAAAQKKAQEQEAIQAISPAVAAAFEDPSDAGLDAAFSMVPEQYRDAADQQLAQLRAIPDLNRRKSMIRSALLQDDYGRALLAQIEPTANMRLQEGTAARRAALDERRLALEEAKLAAEAEGGGVSPDVAARLQFEREKLAAETAKGTAEETKKRLADEKRAKDIAFAVKEVEAAAKPGGLIDQSTGSYIGNMVDAAAQTFGMGTYGAVANAQMKPVADLVLKLVPRFEGPQSDKDTQSYKDAAGDLANPNLPASVKRAAATQIVTLLKKYSGQFEYGGEDTSGDTVDDSNPLLSTP